MENLPQLDTERLRLQPFHSADLEAFHQICRDPETMRFMPSPPHKELQDTQLSLMQEQSREGAMDWAIYHKESDQLIGKINYLGETRVPGLGYILKRSYWGQGFATEAVARAVSYGFDELSLPKIELWIDERNVASQRVAVKTGFALKSRLPLKYPHNEQNHIMYVFGRENDKMAQPAGRFFGVEPILGTHDVAASVAYYRDKLGFNVDFRYGDPPEHAAVSRGDWSGSTTTFQITALPSDHELAASMFLYVRVDSCIDQIADSFRANGVEIVNGPETYPWGMREFTVRDCHGYLLRFGTQA